MDLNLRSPDDEVESRNHEAQRQDGLDHRRRPTVSKYMGRKTSDYDRWLGGMRRFRRSLFPDNGMMDLGDEPGEEMSRMRKG